MRVVFFERRPLPFHYSLERVFSEIKKNVANEHDVSACQMPFYSQGIWPRVKNILWCRSKQGDINHITGDVHYVALALDRKRTILTIHDLNFLSEKSRLASFILKLFWLTLPTRRVRFVTVISEATKKELLSRIKIREDKVRVIPDYVNPAITPYRQEFNKQSPRILQVGTGKNKNIPRLIQALKGLSCHLVIIGKPVEQFRQMLIENSIAYTWLSNLSEAELMNQYNECDLISYVSIAEGFGLPILEAQAVGRPVITSSTSSMPEVAGTAACLIDPYDVNEIRNGIKRIIEDDRYREELIIKGFENIKRFKLDEVCKQYKELYLEVAGQNSK